MPSAKIHEAGTATNDASQHNNSPREDARLIPNLARPPVRLVLRPLEDRNHLALLEAQVARLVGFKRELGNRLVGAQRALARQARRLGEHGLRRCRPARPRAPRRRRSRPVAVDVVVADHAAARSLRREPRRRARLTVVHVVGPRAAALPLRREPVVVAAAPARARAHHGARARAVRAHSLAVRRAGPVLPYHIVVLLGIDGDVVVHAVTRTRSGAADAGEHARVENLHKRLRCRWNGHGTAQQIGRLDGRAVKLLIGVAPLNHDATF